MRFKKKIVESKGNRIFITNCINQFNIKTLQMKTIHVHNYTSLTPKIQIVHKLIVPTLIYKKYKRQKVKRAIQEQDL